MATPIDSEKLAPSGNPAPLPAIPSVTESSLVSSVSKIKEIIETREGRRGSKYEQVVTWRDLYSVGLISLRSGGSWLMNQQDGAVQGVTIGSRATMGHIETAIRDSAAYKRLMTRTGSEEDLASYPEEVRAILANDLLEEARQRGADIRELQTIIQNGQRSFSMKVTELTAAIGNAQAGISQVSYASATQNQAQAGVITSVQARLDDFGGGGVTVEEKMTATVDRLNGMSGVYSVKIGAGGKWAGLQLAVDAPVGVTPYSSFLIEADKFAIFTSGGDVSPFGVDGSGVYINGTVRINTGGATLASIAARTTLTYIGSFSSAPSGVKDNVYLNTIDGNTYVHNGSGWVLYLQKGSNGSNGSNGSRGSLTLYASGSSWSDSTANSAITSVTGSATKTIGDTVTISNGTSFAGTKYWSGAAWVDPGVIINGNLLVNGTVSASTLTTGQISVPGRDADIYIGGDSSAAFPFNLSAFHIRKTSGTGPAASIIATNSAVALYIAATSASGIQCNTSVSSGIGVQGAASGAGGVGIFGETSQSSGYGGSFNNVGSGTFVAVATSAYALHSSSGKGKFYAVDGLGPFTGFHDSLLPKEITFEVGDIIVDSKIVYKHDVSNALAEVDLSSLPYQKTVIGIATDAREVDNFLELPYAMWWDYSHSHVLLSVNALGEGLINVCGENGTIEAGDFIVTSSMHGKGMKQSDDIHRNYTVAKSRETVTFSSLDEVKMIACIYLCG